jgi:hypothetical protein
MRRERKEGMNISDGLCSQADTSSNEIQTLSFHHLHVLCVLPTQTTEMSDHSAEERS